MIDAITLEIKRRKDYIGRNTIETIYFGGGTPSLLKKEHILQIQSAVNDHFEVSKDVEVTFECNPDDLSETYLDTLKATGINRLSIGVQSFDEAQLKKLNRAHDAHEAKKSVELAQKKGFNNITIDLMYGLPDTNLDYWKHQINEALTLGVKHISAYCLTFEEKTVFGKWLDKGKIFPLDDEKNLDQFKLLVEQLKAHGFDHYEISNFALDGSISKHNSAYWLGSSYLGVGPSAHSFNGNSRQWNYANNMAYLKASENNVKHYEEEVLSQKDQYNEYVLTRLRTVWGLEKAKLESVFGAYFEDSRKKFETMVQNGDILETESHFMISDNGKFIVDHLTRELFVI